MFVSEINALQEQLNRLSESLKKLVEEDNVYENEVYALNGVPFGGYINKNRLKNLQEQRENNYQKQELIGVSILCFQKILDHLQKFESSLNLIDFILSKQSYKELQEKIDEIKNQLESIFCLKKIDLKKCEEINHILEQLNKDFFRNTLKQKQDQRSLEDMYEVADINFYYHSIKDIIVEAITCGYSYDSYYSLAKKFISFQIYEKEVMLQFVLEKEEKDKELKANPYEVIDRNLEKKDIVSLYDKYFLLRYRQKLLNSMYMREDDFEKEDEDIIKLQKINHILTQRKE